MTAGISLIDFESAITELGKTITLESIITVLEGKKPDWRFQSMKYDTGCSQYISGSFQLHQQELKYYILVSKMVTHRWNSEHPAGIYIQTFVASLLEEVNCTSKSINSWGGNAVERLYCDIGEGKYGRIYKSS